MSTKTAAELRAEASEAMRLARIQERVEKRVGDISTLSADGLEFSVSGLIDVSSTRQARGGKSAIVLDADHQVPMGDGRILTVYVKGYLANGSGNGSK